MFFLRLSDFCGKNTHVLKANDPIMHSALMLASSSHREKLLLGNILY